MNAGPRDFRREYSEDHDRSRVSSYLVSHYVFQIYVIKILKNVEFSKNQFIISVGTLLIF